MPNRHRFVTWALSAALVFTSSYGDAQAESATVGISALPAGRGNPYSAIYIPAVGTWSTIFESLTHVDRNGNLVSWVAASWQREAADRWVFTLQPNLKFSNGEPLDAAAVVATVAYVTGSGQDKGDPVSRELNHVTGAEALSETEVRIQTSGPSPFLPQELINLRLVAPQAWRELAPEEFAAQPVGSGPFQVESWSESRLVLSPNPNAWRAPKLTGLVLQTAPNVTTRLQALQSGNIDIASSIPPDSIPDIEALGGSVYTVPLPGANAVILNTVKDTPFRDRRVRQAMNYAVDKTTIIEQLLGGRTQAVSQPAATTAFGYDPDLQPYPYDPQRARMLLADAGYPEGFAFVMETNGGAGAAATIYQQVATYLAEIGVTMEIRIIPINRVLSNIQQGGWQGEAFAMSYFTPTFDAMRPQRNQSCLWAEPWYCDESIMPQIEAAFAESDLDTRKALTQSIMAHAHREAQGLFLYENVALDGLGPGISGYRSDFGFIHYNEIEKTAAD